MNTHFSSYLFWDVNVNNLQPKIQARFIIGRVLQFGDLSDWRVLCKLYPAKIIKQEAKWLKNLDAKSKALWRVVLR